MQLSQALFKGSHATMQTTQRRYHCATALRPFLEGRKSNSMKSESPYLQDGHLMSTLKNCGDIGWDLFRYLQLSVELCWHHKWATELADILRFMYLLTWLKIHVMVNSTPSLSRILELSLKSSDSSSVDQDHAEAVRADLRWFAVRLKRPDQPLQEDRGRC